MNSLVTGAAGYIGSVVAEELIREGHNIIAFDNLAQGHRQALLSETTFIRGDLSDKKALDGLFSSQTIDAVVHVAADSEVGASVTNPLRFFENNVANGLNLLSSMLDNGVSKIIFSSSAAVYGEPQSLPVQEGHPERPVNAYGESKLMFEKILFRFGEAYGLSYISLHYFNAAGATQTHGEDHRPETHLIPKILKVALGQEENVPIYGTDYDTDDGTCIRDYIHVADLAVAHALALRNVERLSGRFFNVASSKGYSVMQIIETARGITGASIPTLTRPRRAGDPARLVASLVSRKWIYNVPSCRVAAPIV